MATVKISDKLCEIILGQHNAASELLYKPLEVSIKDKVLARIAEVGIEKVERYFWPEHYDLRKLMPEKWLNKKDTLDITVYIHDAEGEKASTVFTTTMWSSDLSTHLGVSGLFLPPNTNVWRPSLKLSLSGLFASPDECAEVTRLHEQRVELEAQARAQRGTLKALLNSATSLNRVLKDFPEVKAFVPKEYLRRVEEKAYRGPVAPKPTQDAPIFDAEAFKNSLAVAATVQLLNK